ncbi:MAG: hypothetical protein JW774_07820, partial [Candidatus Aureabacteria bacterium]|nr:hypothetical protein [Candidatus Auribacterota bacterium]
TITQFGNRILAAAGKSTNIELFTHRIKFGGNGPIMAHSLANLGLGVNYIGALGHPDIHEAFKELNPLCRLTTLDEPGHTQAVEFSDGKIMFGRLAMTHLTWERLLEKTGQEKLRSFFGNTPLLGMVNWTQTPFMEEIWNHLLTDFLKTTPFPQGKPYLFIDLADPQKRNRKDILAMLAQLREFEQYYRVILGLNEKESCEIINVLNGPGEATNMESMQKRAEWIRKSWNLTCCVIHPVEYAVCSFENNTYSQKGPYLQNPIITTGAGDHFNAGFCFGLITGCSPQESLILGTANSGYYVRQAQSATSPQLAQFINEWHHNKH